jgi:hypothetical protein
LHIIKKNCLLNSLFLIYSFVLKNKNLTHRIREKKQYIF